MAFINHNGKITDDNTGGLPYDSRACRYGYSLFETMLVRDGAIRLAEYHWQRLFDSMKALAFEMPKLWNAEYLEKEVLRTVEKNKLQELCRVRLQVYAGRGGIYDRSDNAAAFLIECFPLEEHVVLLNEQGLTVGIADGLMKSADNIANFKSGNALLYAMAAKQAQQNKWNDALIQNTDGNIIESAIANIWCVKNGVLYTPPLSEGCVAGTVRQYMLDVLPKHGFKIQEEALTKERLQQAEEVFLTNGIKMVRWIKSIAGIDKEYTSNVSKKIADIIITV